MSIIKNRKVPAIVRAKISALEDKIKDSQSAKVRIREVLIRMCDTFDAQKESYEKMLQAKYKLEVQAKKNEQLKPMYEKMEAQCADMKARLEKFKKSIAEIEAKSEYAEAQIIALEALKDAQAACEVSLFEDNEFNPDNFMKEIDAMVEKADRDLKVAVDLASI